MVFSAPQQLPPGIDPVSCPNFPFCGPSPAEAPAAAGAPAANTQVNFFNDYLEFS